MGSLGGDWLMFVHMASPCTWPHTNLKAGQPQALQHRLPRASPESLDPPRLNTCTEHLASMAHIHGCCVASASPATTSPSQHWGLPGVTGASLGRGPPPA